jgi:hypothetical protein
MAAAASDDSRPLVAWDPECTGRLDDLYAAKIKVSSQITVNCDSSK